MDGELTTTVEVSTLFSITSDLLTFTESLLVGVAFNKKYKTIQYNIMGGKFLKEE